MDSIYVASSWRNKLYPRVVEGLRALGHSVYDFKAPENAFEWKALDPDWQKWTPAQFRDALEGPIAQQGFAADAGALRAAEVVVLVLPAGASAHSEAGWAAGAGKPVAVLVPEGTFEELYDAKATTHAVAPRAPWEPELMYKLYERIVTTVDEAVAWAHDKALDKYRLTPEEIQILKQMAGVVVKEG